MSFALPPSFFTPGVPITIARAPGRLDVMGGVADYSGSLVLEAPLARGTTCAAQPRGDRQVHVWSEGMERHGAVPRWEGSLDTVLIRSGEGYAEVRHRLTSGPSTAWAAYAAGVVTVLHAEGHLPHPTGLNLFIDGDLPLGGGVSSSASLEVAVMLAVCGAFQVDLDRLHIARLCQQVENRVVGAPCGIMDQVTCALGEAGRLIAICCRPCEVMGQCPLPEEAALIGINSGVKHSVGGTRYTRARIAAFMGLKLIRRIAPRLALTCLCDLDPVPFRSQFYSHLPSRLKGEQFLAELGETGDPVTTIDPEESYPVRGAVEHAVYENHRVERFIEHLERASGDRRALDRAGRLMYASHWSYGHRIGLGAPETDLLVRLARQAGPAAGIFGAKITGGGSGGTIALLTARDGRGTVESIAMEYAARTGLEAEVLDTAGSGSEPSWVRTGPA